MMKFYKVKLTNINFNNENVLMYAHLDLMILYSWYEIEELSKFSALELDEIKYHKSKMRKIQKQIDEYENKNCLKKEIVLIKILDGVYFEPYTRQIIPETFKTESIDFKEAITYFRKNSADEVKQIKSMFKEYHKRRKTEENSEDYEYDQVVKKLDNIIYKEETEDAKKRRAKIIQFPKKDIE